jgi:hypothetical protein
MAKKLNAKTTARTVDALRKVLTFTGEKTLDKLAKECGAYSRRTAENNARKTKLISEAADKSRLHKGAFRDVLKFLDMDEGKRAIYLASFDHYRDKLGLDNIKQGSLNFEEEPADTKAKAKANGDDPPRATDLINKDKLPTTAEITRIADRAEEKTALDVG